MRPLKFLLFNLEDFFIFPPREMQVFNPQGMTEGDWRSLNRHRQVKELGHLWSIARIFKDEEPDIAFLTEVGSYEALAFFNRWFLGNQFDIYLEAGNSQRGIEVGYLVRKDLGLKIEQTSYAKRPLNAYKKFRPLADNIIEKVNEIAKVGANYFARDVSQLTIFQPGKKEPSLVTLLTHFKSQRQDGSLDRDGKIRRWLEFCELRMIVSEIEEKFGAALPLMIAGDFNGCIHRTRPAPEFSGIKDLNWVDIFDLDQLPPDKRYTRVGISGRNPRLASQLDYIFVNNEMARYFVLGSAHVRPHHDACGREIGMKVKKTQRQRLCSDHMPAFAEFAMEMDQRGRTWPES